LEDSWPMRHIRKILVLPHGQIVLKGPKRENEKRR